jgi:methyl-accepting chemotaxis protein
MNIRRLLSKTKLSHKLFWIITLLNTLTISAFTFYNYENQKMTILQGIDSKLLASAQGTKISMDKYHESLIKAGTVDQSEYRKLLDDLSIFANGAGVKYAYTVIEKKSGVIFTSSSYTREELEKGELTGLFEQYKDAPEGLKKALESNKIVYDQYTDKWGSFRSIFLPSSLSNGTTYAIGIDIGLDEINLALRRTLFGCLMIGACVFAAGIIVALLVASYISRGIRRVAMYLNKVADGNLGFLIENTTDDELGMLSQDLNRMIEKLRTLIRSVFDASNSVVTAANQFHMTSIKMSTGVEEVAAQAMAVATAAEQMAATSNEIAKNCGIAAQSVKDTEGIAQTAEGIVCQTVQMMNSIADLVIESAGTVKELGGSSDQIGDIIGTIDEIADQTNLLALNAAIEAARAGENGRGFAVVADEVRALAERTSKATQEIAKMIKSIQLKTKDAVYSMEEGVTKVARGTEEAAKSGNALQDILKHAHTITAQVNQVAVAAGEQTTSTSEISNNINLITTVAQGTVNEVQSSVASTSQLINLACELQRQVGQFKLAA